MRVSICLTVLILLAAAPVTGQEDDGHPVIAELLPDPGEDREFIELWNPGDAPRSLTGYEVRDAAGNNFTFDAHTLDAGERIVVWGGGEGDAAGPAWNRATVWNNGGDTAILLAPDGSEVDRFSYGVEDGPLAPDTGVALYLEDGTWQAGGPTPGTAPGSQAAPLQGSVPDVPPEAGLQGPATVRPGATATLTVSAHDDNGAQDIAGWTLSDPSGTIKSGTGTTDAVAVTAPATPGPWTLALEVTDQGGAQDTATLRVEVTDRALRLHLPDHGNLRFPPLTPGAQDLVGLDNLTIHNDGEQVLRPLLDISPFRNDGGNTIPVDDNLRLGIRAVGNSTIVWQDYAGPLTRLPDLEPGEAIEVTLILEKVPTPLPAGQYGTSFTVVPR